MPIIKNGKNVTAIYKGTTPIIKVYKGLQLVWEAFKNLIVSGVPPLTLPNSIGKPIVDYQIYGNSIQASDPTPTAPVEVESVGNKTKNLVNSKVINNYIGGERLDMLITIDKNNIVLTNQGSSNYVYISNDLSNKMLFDRLKPNTSYYISYSATALAGEIRTTSGRICFVDSENAILKQCYILPLGEIGSTQYYKGSFVTGEDASIYSKILIYNVNGLGGQIKISDLQVEEGDVATDYEPYGYEIPVVVNNATTSIYLDEPLRKISTYADYIDFANKKVVRNIKQITYTGEETFIDFDSNVFTTTTITKGLTASNNILLCNICIPSRATTLGWRNNSVNSFQINKSWIGATTVDELKTVLQGLSEQLKIYYVLATPTEEAIELPTIPTITSTCIVDVGTAVTPSDMEVTYKGR